MRAFIRYTPQKYDLIVFGLLDSHTLLTSLSGVRLDSYIYTTDCFRDARAKLKDGGVICLTFVMLTKEIGRKLYLMLKEAFGGVSRSSSKPIRRRLLVCHRRTSPAANASVGCRRFETCHASLRR